MVAWNTQMIIFGWCVSFLMGISNVYLYIKQFDAVWDKDAQPNPTFQLHKSLY